MNIEAVRDYCLSKRGVEESFPFDEETLVFKVCNKIFAVIALEKPDRVTLKCHPSLREELGARYIAVTSAPYFNKASWATLVFNQDIPDDLFCFLIDHAYGETIRCIPKKRQVEFFKESLPPTVNYCHLNVCNSTMEECGSTQDLPHTNRLNLVTTDLQRKGRGQRGNSWESENGKNLLFSCVFCPEAITASEQFRLSQAISLALLSAIRRHCPPHLSSIAEKFSIKWPNDIYFDSFKVGGMLLEHTLKGDRILRTVIGIGLNINQNTFQSDAPNPISLLNVFGFELPRFVLLETIMQQLKLYLQLISDTSSLQNKYLSNLWRRDGFHPFRDDEGTFYAAIKDVLPDGRIILRKNDNTQHAYGFKEVRFEGLGSTPE